MPFCPSTTKLAFARSSSDSSADFGSEGDAENSLGEIHDEEEGEDNIISCFLSQFPRGGAMGSDSTPKK